MTISKEARNIIIKCGNDFLLPIILMLGFYLILHGHLTPEGGFSGGIVISLGVMLIYLAYGIKGLKNIFPAALKHTDNILSIIYTSFAVLGLAMGANLCNNVLFNYGGIGEFYSSGTIFWMNISAGLKVMTGAGFLLVIMLFSLNPEKQSE